MELVYLQKIYLSMLSERGVPRYTSSKISRGTVRMASIVDARILAKQIRVSRLPQLPAFACKFRGCRRLLKSHRVDSGKEKDASWRWPRDERSRCRCETRRVVSSTSFPTASHLGESSTWQIAAPGCREGIRERSDSRLKRASTRLVRHFPSRLEIMGGSIARLPREFPSDTPRPRDPRRNPAVRFRARIHAGCPRRDSGKTRSLSAIMASFADVAGAFRSVARYGMCDETENDANGARLHVVPSAGGNWR